MHKSQNSNQPHMPTRGSPSWGRDTVWRQLTTAHACNRTTSWILQVMQKSIQNFVPHSRGPSCSMNEYGSRIRWGYWWSRIQAGIVSPMPWSLLKKCYFGDNFISFPLFITKTSHAHTQRLKAALHYGVGHVCSEVEGMTFSRELVATITETAFKQCELLATDLELFAK